MNNEIGKLKFNVEATVSLKDIDPPITIGGSFGFDHNLPGSKNVSLDSTTIKVNRPKEPSTINVKPESKSPIP